MKKMLLLYLPLALPAALMGISHTIISGALARMEEAAVLLAAYALSSGITTVGEAPLTSGRQSAIALVRDRQSWRVVRAVTMTVGLSSLAIQLVVGWGPLTVPVLQGMFGVPEYLLHPTLTSYRLFMWLTVISIWRFLCQGLTIAHRQPLYVTGGVVGRIPFMFLTAWGAVRYGWFGSQLAGAAILLSAIVVETSVAVFGARRILAHLPEKTDETPPLTFGAGMRFLLPLAGAWFAWAVGRPLISSAVGRTEFAGEALAAIALANIPYWVLLGLLSALHQVTAVFVPEPGGRRATLRFALGAGIIATLVIAVLGFTPAGANLITITIGAPENLAPIVIASFRPLIAWPILYALVEHTQGVLLVERNSRLIGLARFAGVGASVALVWALVGRVDSAVAAATLAAWGTVLSAVTELAILHAPRLFTQLASRAYRG